MEPERGWGVYLPIWYVEIWTFCILFSVIRQEEMASQLVRYSHNHTHKSPAGLVLGDLLHSTPRGSTDKPRQLTTARGSTWSHIYNLSGKRSLNNNSNSATAPLRCMCHPPRSPAVTTYKQLKEQRAQIPVWSARHAVQLYEVLC